MGHKVRFGATVGVVGVPGAAVGTAIMAAGLVPLVVPMAAGAAAGAAPITFLAAQDPAVPAVRA